MCMTHKRPPCRTGAPDCEWSGARCPPECNGSHPGVRTCGRQKWCRSPHLSTCRIRMCLSCKTGVPGCEWSGAGCPPASTRVRPYACTCSRHLSYRSCWWHPPTCMPHRCPLCKIGAPGGRWSGARYRPACSRWHLRGDRDSRHFPYGSHRLRPPMCKNHTRSRKGLCVRDCSPPPPRCRSSRSPSARAQ